jgi:hypothetical protein
LEQPRFEIADGLRLTLNLDLDLNYWKAEHSCCPHLHPRNRWHFPHFRNCECFESVPAHIGAAAAVAGYDSGSGSGSGPDSFEAIVLIAMFADSSLMFVLVEPLSAAAYLEPQAHRHNLNIANIQTSPNKNVYNILFSFILLSLNHWIALDCIGFMYYDLRVCFFGIYQKNKI